MEAKKFFQDGSEHGSATTEAGYDEATFTAILQAFDRSRLNLIALEKPDEALLTSIRGGCVS